MSDKEKELPETAENSSRRAFMKTTAGAGVVGATGLLGIAPNAAADNGSFFGGRSFPKRGLARAKAALKIRLRAAQKQFSDSVNLGPQRSNGDEARYADDRYYASFAKTLPQNRFGEVNPSAFEALLFAAETGKSRDYDQIPLARVAERKLADPQGAHRFIFTGLDGHATRMRPAPTFRSAETAAEQAEVYWLALTRDVDFRDYGSDPLIAAAIADLNNLSEPVGPKENGQVTVNTLFRGSTPGDLTGPFVSQFLWKDIPYGLSTIVQRYPIPDVEDFMTTEQEWLAIQRGANPTRATSFGFEHQYLNSNRGMGEWVHNDVLFQAYFNAAMISLKYGAAAIDAGNPYFNGSIANQGAFTSLGGPYVIDMLTQAGNLALQGAWYQKWLAHRRLRPESYGGRVHFMASGQKSYELHSDILNSDAIQRVYSQNGTYLLPMSFPEGSPTHPAYPAGHATVAGACTTVLKAFFNEDFVIPDPQEPDFSNTLLVDYVGDDLTLGGEFNKLANNVALSRDAAGVHFRSDGVDGLLVGEQQTIGLLKDYSIALNEDFGGFSLTRFDGTKVLIKNGKVRNA